MQERREEKGAWTQELRKMDWSGMRASYLFVQPLFIELLLCTMPWVPGYLPRDLVVNREVFPGLMELKAS